MLLGACAKPAAPTSSQADHASGAAFATFAEVADRPFPETTSVFWVLDARGAPIKGAHITWRGPVSGGTNAGQANGIYPAPDLPPGVYKLSATALGQAPWSTHLRVVAPGQRVQVKIIMAGPQVIYFPTPQGPIPVHDPREYVSFQHKQPRLENDDPSRMQAILQELQAEAKALATLLPPALQATATFDCMPWPTAPDQRQAFEQAIAQSPVLQTHSLYIVGDCADSVALFRQVEMMIAGTVDEATIRQELTRQHFVVQELRLTQYVPDPDFWRIRATYEPPLSLDFLRALRKVEVALPVFDIQINHTIFDKHYRPGIKPDSFRSNSGGSDGRRARLS